MHVNHQQDRVNSRMTSQSYFIRRRACGVSYIGLCENVRYEHGLLSSRRVHSIIAWVKEHTLASGCNNRQPVQQFLCPERLSSRTKGIPVPGGVSQPLRSASAGRPQSFVAVVAAAGLPPSRPACSRFACSGPSDPYDTVPATCPCTVEA